MLRSLPRSQATARALPFIRTKGASLATVRYVPNRAASDSASSRSASTSTAGTSIIYDGVGLSRNGDSGKEKVVVLGSGWGGFNAARKLDKKKFDVTVVSPNSYFSFTPFLASTCVGTLEFRCATEPVRGIKHVNYAQGWADSVDFNNKTLRVSPALPPLKNTKSDIPASAASGAGAELHAAYSPGDAYYVHYDKLVIATGCRSASFNTPGVMEYAHFLKNVSEARAIRLKLLTLLEMASEPSATEEEKRQLLSFRVVGGGPTGVEFAAELHDFVQSDVARLYPHIADLITINLYDAAPGILQSFDNSLRSYAERKFHRDGVKVHGGAKISAVGKDWIQVEGGEKLPTGLLVWNTGLQPNEFCIGLQGVSKDSRTKSLRVDEHLHVLDDSGTPMPSVYAIGDNAMTGEGHRLPATAQVASQMATYTAKSLNGGDVRPEPFKWKNYGSMVFIGDYRAMVDRSAADTEGPRSRLAGWAAWLVWRSYYMTLAMGWRNKILIPVYWSLAALFGRDITSF